MRFDILIAQSMRHRPARLLQAMCDGAAANGVDAVTMRDYAPREGAVFMTYGLGGRDRLPHAQEHMRKGGRVVAWDAGYWERKTQDRRYRVSLDGFHCPQRIMRGPRPSSERWRDSGLSVTNCSHPDGHIVLVGNGPKSRAVGAEGWAAAKSREIRAKFPRRIIIYRPKRGAMEAGVDCDGVDRVSPIEKVLDRASLAVCLHSNVAVDACRMGVPVVCEDGAAAAIYPSRLEDAANQPSIERRAEFLHRLAWFQWSASEIARGRHWEWLLMQLSWQGESE